MWVLTPEDEEEIRTTICEAIPKKTKVAAQFYLSMVFIEEIAAMTLNEMHKMADLLQIPQTAGNTESRILELRKFANAFIHYIE